MKKLVLLCVLSLLITDSFARGSSRGGSRGAYKSSGSFYYPTYSELPEITTPPVVEINTDKTEITGEPHQIGKITRVTYYVCKSPSGSIRYSTYQCNYALMNETEVFVNAQQEDIVEVDTQFGGSNSHSDMKDRDEYGHELLTGPRGGCYYITASGEHEYVERYKCH